MPQNVGGISISTTYVVNQNSYRQVVNNINQISRQATQMSNTFANVGKVFGNMGKIAATAFSVRAITNFTKSAINLASDLDEVQNVVDVTFGAMAQDINEFAKTSIKAFGMSETSAKQYSSTIGAIAKSMGFATNDALTMGKTMTALAADMASFYNLDTEEAFNKIRSGLTGQTEPLKSLGINMSIANLEAYALSQGITKSVSAMSEQEKMLLRNNYLLSVTKDAQGDFIRNQDSWANQTRILTEQWNTFKTTLGNIGIKFILPIIQSFNSLFSYIQSTTDVFASFIGIATNTEVSKGASQGASAVEDIADGYKEVEKAAKKAKGGVASFDKVIQLSKPADTSGGGASGTGGNSLGVGLSTYDFTPKDEGLVNGMKGQLDKIKELFKGIEKPNLDFDWGTIKENAKNTVENILSTFKNIGTFTLDIVFKVWNDADGVGIIEGIISTFEKLTGVISTAVETITPALTSFYDVGIAPIVSWVGEKLKDALNTVGVELDKWSLWFIENKESIVDFATKLGQLVNTLWLVIEPIADATWGVFKTIFSGLGDVIREVFGFILDNQDGVILALTTLAGVWAGFKIIGIAEATTLFLANSASILANTTGVIANTVAQGGLITSFTTLLGAKMADIAANIQLGLLYAKDIIDHTILIGLYAKDAVVRGALAVQTGVLTVAQGAWNVATTVGTAVGGAFGAVMAFLTSPIGLVVAAIAAAIAIGVLLYKNWDTVMEWGKKLGDWLKKAFVTDFSESFGFVGDILNGFFDNVENIFNSVKQTFGGVIDFVVGVFTGDWKRAFGGLKDVVVGVFKGLASIVMQPFMSVITIWNSIVDKIGSLKIPDWVPVLGGKSFNLPQIPKPQIALKDGGIVTGRTWAEIGEAGPEAVVPLKNDNYTDALAQNVANRVGGRNGGREREQVINLNIYIDKNFGSDYSEIADHVEKALERKNLRVGGVNYGF